MSQLALHGTLAPSQRWFSGALQGAWIILAATLLLAGCGSDGVDAEETGEETDSSGESSPPSATADVGGGSSDPSDADPGTQLPAVNACGGFGVLTWQGEEGVLGESCGPYGEGTLVCGGLDVLQCVGQAAINICGARGVLSVEIGAACGVCAGLDDEGAGTWVCGPEGDPICVGASDANGCGGCAALPGRPGGLCADGEGRWVCASRETLACEGTDENACGGAGVLRFEGQPVLPGDACDAGCGTGVLVCSDDSPGELECVAGNFGRPANECGGCETLPGRIGETCGPCGGGSWACDGEGGAVCLGATSPDGCGGCTDRSERPGEACGVDGIWLCAGSNLTCGSVIRPEDRNPCGGADTLAEQPGTACGTCGDGLHVCVTPNTVECLGGEALNSCGGCGPLRGVETQPCGECGSGALACGADNASLDCVGDLGANARNACGRCTELPVDLGDSCGTCLEWACGPTGGVRCELNAGLSGCGFTTCADLDCRSQSRSCIPSDGASDAACDVCLKGFVERGGVCVDADGAPTDVPDPTALPPDPTDPPDPDCEDPDLTLCEEECVNLQTDSLHCGVCSNDCGAFGVCEAGHCDICLEPNDCEGCDELEGTPGASCGECGTLVCDGREALVCEDDGFNACGGCANLGPGGILGAPCGPCADGVFVCDGDGESLLCDGASAECPWRVVFAGYEQSCALTDADTLWCWGAVTDQSYATTWGYQLGAGTADGSATPVQVLAAADAAESTWSDWTDVSPGGGFSCGIRESGTLWCWGTNFAGQLGIGLDGDASSRPVQVVAAADAVEEHWSDWTSVSVGYRHACGVREGGTLWCWGESRDGALGAGEGVESSSYPVQVLNSAGTAPWTDWVAVSSGIVGTCALREAGTLWCWGRGGAGERGDGTNSGDRYTPAFVVAAEEEGGPPWSDWTDFGTGGQRTCALREDNSAWCWGFGSNGSRGDGTGIPNRTTPARVLANAESEDDPWSNWISISSGLSSGGHSCGLRIDGSLWCWGSARNGALGNGMSGDWGRTTPTRVVANEESEDEPWSDWSAVSAGSAHTCGVRENGTLWCWGNRIYGQVGDGVVPEDPQGEERLRTTPVEVRIPGF